MRRALFLSIFSMIVIASCDSPPCSVGNPPSRSANTSVVVAPLNTDLATPAASAPVSSQPEEKSLTAASPMVALPVSGFGDAVVSLPIGTRVRRPIVLAVHGNYDRPEWQCGVWRSIVKNRAFVLCPRGVQRLDSPSADDVRFTYDGGVAVTKELDAGLAALRERFAEFLDDGPMIYTGFSLGAITGVGYLLRDPAKMPRAVLTEGSHGQWTPAAVSSFAKRGGVRLLFACGQPACVTMSNSVAAAMKKSGLDSKVVHGKGVGHGYDGLVADRIREELEWLVSDDPRWSVP